MRFWALFRARRWKEGDRRGCLCKFQKALGVAASSIMHALDSRCKKPRLHQDGGEQMLAKNPVEMSLRLQRFRSNPRPSVTGTLVYNGVGGLPFPAPVLAGFRLSGLGPVSSKNDHNSCAR
ncbi:hypothetical protein ISCGN_000573 [Ixodes scapularis]